ncbi:hypothetical protein MMC07_007923 [Pseudocyphellaria aurata]|nr:hypothetical protein [Pseudocyphellaria aurata]
MPESNSSNGAPARGGPGGPIRRSRSRRHGSPYAGFSPRRDRDNSIGNTHGGESGPMVSPRLPGASSSGNSPGADSTLEVPPQPSPTAIQMTPTLAHQPSPTSGNSHLTGSEPDIDNPHIRRARSDTGFREWLARNVPHSERLFEARPLTSRILEEQMFSLRLEGIGPSEPGREFDVSEEDRGLGRRPEDSGNSHLTGSEPEIDNSHVSRARSDTDGGFGEWLARNVPHRELLFEVRLVNSRILEEQMFSPRLEGIGPSEPGREFDISEEDRGLGRRPEDFGNSHLTGSQPDIDNAHINRAPSDTNGARPIVIPIPIFSTRLEGIDPSEPGREFDIFEEFFEEGRRSGRRPEGFGTVDTIMTRLPPVDTASLGEREKSCPVCLNDYNRPGSATSSRPSETEHAVRLPCHHVIGRECIRYWLQDGNITCPLCRANIHGL